MKLSISKPASDLTEERTLWQPPSPWLHRGPSGGCSWMGSRIQDFANLPGDSQLAVKAKNQPTARLTNEQVLGYQAPRQDRVRAEPIGPKTPAKLRNYT